MSDIDCYTIHSESGLPHGILFKDQGHWTYRKYYPDGHRDPDQKLTNDEFILHRNTNYPDKDGVDPTNNGVKSTVDWSTLTVTTSTGIALKLEPNKFTESSK